MKLVQLSQTNQLKKVVISSGCSYLLVMLSDIIYCKAVRNYTCIYLTVGKKYLSSKCLTHYRKMLEPFGFVHVSKSYLVNFWHIQCISVNGKSSITLTNNEMLNLPRRKKMLFQQIIAGCEDNC